MGRLLSIFKLFRHDLIVMLIAMRNRQTPKSIKALLLVAVLYLISPIDLIPDAIPLVGVLDDVLIVPAVLEGLTKLLPPQVRYEAESKADYVAKYLPIVMIVASLAILSWVALIVYGFYKLFF